MSFQSSLYSPSVTNLLLSYSDDIPRKDLFFLKYNQYIIDKGHECTLVIAACAWLINRCCLWISNRLNNHIMRIVTFEFYKSANGIQIAMKWFTCLTGFPIRDPFPIGFSTTGYTFPMTTQEMMMTISFCESV